MSYGLSVKLLAEVLPIDERLNATTICNHTQRLSNRLDAELGEDVLTWTGTITSWMVEHRVSTIPLVQLQQAVQMPLVQLWLALLLGEYAIEQRGEFYDVQQIWVSAG